MLGTTAAENIAYTELEARVRSHALVRHCLVIGHERPHASALVTLDPDSVRKWQRARNRPAGSSMADMVRAKEMSAEIQRAVDDANTVLTTAHGIKRFRVLPTEFTHERGELGPDGELLRDAIVENFREDVEALYR